MKVLEQSFVQTSKFVFLGRPNCKHVLMLRAILPDLRPH